MMESYGQTRQEVTRPLLSGAATAMKSKFLGVTSATRFRSGSIDSGVVKKFSKLIFY